MRKVIAMAICLILPLGCGGTVPVQPVPAAGRGPAASQAATTQPAEREIMAYVNGQPMYMDSLYELLLGGPGMDYAVELVRHEMVRQAAEKQGITISDEELKAEHQRFLEVAFPQLEPAGDREQALNQLLVSKQVSRRQWDMSIRMSAILRRMAAPEVKVGDEQLRDEFGRRYERKVVVRHIQTASLTDAQKVKTLAADRDFAALAAEYSTNMMSARGGGELPPIGHKTEGVPPAMRQAALAMKKIGEISDPVQVGTTFHVLKLERIIEPEKVKFEDVREKLAAEIKERLIRLRQKAILERLVRDAEVKYVNPILKDRDAAAKLQQGAVR